jgi:two-component system, OmpR family, alkaline phosphatase synthesis response regulator PhoP
MNHTEAHILVVDDEAAIQYAISKSLQKLGYVVDSASTGEDALAFLKSQDYDVILTDIRMPGISGVELLGKVRESHPDTSVIMMTGYADFDTAVESLRLGATDYLRKPSSNKDIRESVEKGIQRAQSMRKRRKLLSAIQSNLEELAAADLDDGPRISTPLDEAEDRASDHLPPVTALQAIELGALTLYPGRYQIELHGHLIDLTPTEFDLLMYLATHRGRVVPCSELVREVRNHATDEEEAREIIRPHVSNLRRKVKLKNQELDLVVNVRGMGYRLADLDR